MSELPRVETLILPPHSSRQSNSCDKHPDEHFTGFCPSCLCDRLAELEPKSSASRKFPLITTSTATAALKAIFKPSSAAPRVSSSSHPHLRRTKSFSASKNEGLPFLFEPQRKSCDVRVRSTLSFLFSRNDNVAGIAEVDPPISTSSIPLPLLEEQGLVIQNQGIRVNEEILEVENEGIQVVVEPEEFLKNLPCAELTDGLKLMENDCPVKKRDLKEIAGSFWSAASVFSKRLQKWRHKQKEKKQTREESTNRGRDLAERKRNLRDTFSEVADYGYGRRSCDVDPRISFEDQPRYSLDAPRASWDGYLMPGRISSSTFTKMPTMSEDCPIANNIDGIVDSHCNGNMMARSDWQIPVEFDEMPGGTLQTREYYMDTSSRRKRSVDRSNSIRKTAAAVVAEIDALKNARNGKVNLDLRDPFAVREDCSTTCDLDGKLGGKIRAKKSWWRIWGFMQRRKEGRGNSLMERSMSETWQDLRSVRNGEFRCGGERRSSSRKRNERYSPTRIDAGSLKLYMTPVRGSRGGKDKPPYHSPSVATTVTRMY